MKETTLLPYSESAGLRLTAKIEYFKRSGWRIFNYLLFIFLKIFYLFIHEREREKQRHRQREKQGPRREPVARLYPRSRDHAWSQRQTLNR